MSLVFGAAATDEVALAAGLNNQHTFTILMWHYPTTRTNGRYFSYKGASADKGVFWSNVGNGPHLGVARATLAASAESSKTYTLNQWWYNAFTYDESDGPRIFSGDLATLASEDSSVATFPVVGTGASSDDSGAGWRFGGAAVLSRAYQGRIAIFAHYRRRFSLAEIIASQFLPRTDADCDIFIEAGWNGTGTQPNWTTLGAGINGTVAGATVGPHVPLASPFGREAVA